MVHSSAGRLSTLWTDIKAFRFRSQQKQRLETCDDSLSQVIHADVAHIVVEYLMEDKDAFEHIRHTFYNKTKGPRPDCRICNATLNRGVATDWCRSFLGNSLYCVTGITGLALISVVAGLVLFVAWYVVLVKFDL